VSLLSFDNDSWTGLVDPPIDVLEQPVDEMARAAARAVMAALSSATPSSGRSSKVKAGKLARVQLEFPARLIIRGSCAPPAKPEGLPGSLARR
jgi:LacI family transcriptional regulator